MAYADKDQEREFLQLFISARESATRERLEIIRSSEAPDFFCATPNGMIVGVEHTKIAYAEEINGIMGIRQEDRQIDNFELFWATHVAVSKKAQKRQRPHWQTPDSTILVLDMVQGYRIQDWPNDSSLSDEFADFGFLEIWLSDHSSIEAFGEVTLLGVYPPSIWGLNGQGYLFGIRYK